jgi:monoamine oxidase
MSMRRREWLIGAGAAAASAAVPGVLGGVAAAATGARAGGGPETVDVAIVGGGLAGLNAAMTLAGQGARVLVLEGDTRAGGRVRTADDFPHHPDLGGVQIGPMYARVRDVARRLNLKLEAGAHVNAPYSFVMQGTLIPAKQWPESPLNRLVGDERRVPPQGLGAHYVERRTPFTSLEDWMKPEASRYDISLAQWLIEQNASPEATRLIHLSQGSTPLEQMALLRMMQEATRSKVDVKSVAAMPGMEGKDVFERFALASSHVVGGTSRLVEAIGASLGDSLRLGARVRSIRMGDDGAELRCANGLRVRAKYVVVAVPFSVLREIEISPGLQGELADAVKRMPYHNQSQVWLRATKPYWEEDGIEASMWTDGPVTLVRQQIEHDGTRELISALAFGPKSRTLDAMAPADRGRLVLDYLHRIRPSMVGRLEVVGTHSWALVPTIRGCSHQYVPGKVMAWSQAMMKPHERLHFAGEHTRRLEVGMESAMETGERAALEILERLSA